jgi:serine O-acetyltransferase
MSTPIIDFFSILQNNQKQNWVKGIESKRIINWLDHLLDILFPKNATNIEEIQLKWNQNQYDLTRFLNDLIKEESKHTISSNVAAFYSEIPNLYTAMQADAKALLDSDPAAVSISEIMNTYPGFFAISVYRIANTIAHLNIPLIPRILTEYAHSKTGIDIHPKASIGVPFIIDHGTGIVIGETTTIGKNVQIYQGVTLGALQVEKSMQEKKRHPTVEDHVIIYANATILGGSTVIGNNSVIGGNTFLTKSVNPYSIVMQTTKNNILDQQEIKNINTFTI